MKIKYSLNRALLTGTLGLLTIFPNGGQAAANSSLAEANNAFAIDLFKQATKPSENAVFSPYSISAAFAMAYAGAAGQTADQMQKVMHWSGPASKIAADFTALDQILKDAQKSGALELSIANTLWPQKGFAFQKDYLAVLEGKFKTSLHEADFAKQPEAERSRINLWVEQQTKARIKDLLPPGSVSSLTRLVLANAIYFKAGWQTPFSTNSTRPAPFYLAAGGSVSTPLMAKESNFRYALMPNFKILELPYQGNNLSMLVILPDATNGLAELERELTSAKLEAWTRALRATEVSVFLPKFKLDFQLPLNAAMQALGMTDAFSQKDADFTGMTGKPDLFISQAMHKAFVEVNEEGTEAAAATGIVMNVRSAPRPQQKPVFRADHPFLYLIRHTGTGTILFLGRVTNPV
jgi:serpin B